MQDWTEKYRPKTLDEVIGNKEAKEKLLKWAEEWNKGIIPVKRCVILYGKPGIGKTSAALALARDFGWDVIEMNASDVRNAENVRKIALQGAIHSPILPQEERTSSKHMRRKLILLDEADNLYERRSSETSSSASLDRGGKTEIIETIKVTKQPIILIANDIGQLLRGAEALRNLCEIIRFDERRIRIWEIINHLRRIVKSEGISVSSDILTFIAERCGGDVRSAVRDLQAICTGRNNIPRDARDVLAYRDREHTIYELLREVFKTSNVSTVCRSVQNIDEDPEGLISWIAENIPLEYMDIRDLSRAYDMVSKADVFLGRVRKTRAFGLWRYASDLMTGGVAVSKKRVYPSRVRYNFPSWLIEMKHTKESRESREKLLEKLSKYFHCSKRKVNDFLYMISCIAVKNEEITIHLKKELDLNKNDLLYILSDAEMADRLFKMDFSKSKDKKITRNDVASDKKEDSEKKLVKQEKLF